MKLIAACSFVILSTFLSAQENQTIGRENNIEADTLIQDSRVDIEQIYFDWLNDGHVNYSSNGFLRPTANVMNLSLGHPEKFSVPVYLLVGATIDVKEGRSLFNEDTAFEIINKFGGLVNLGIHGKKQLVALGESSTLFLNYQLGVKSITGIDQENSIKDSFFSRTISSGLTFNTWVWNTDVPDARGVCWLSVDYSLVLNEEEKMFAFFGEMVNPQMWTWIIDGGLNLGGNLNLNITYHQVLGHQEHELFGDDILTIAADIIFDGM